MSIFTRAAPTPSGAVDATKRSVGTLSHTRRRTRNVLAGITVAAFAILVDLLLAGHTVGEEIWGPVTALAATVVGAASLAYLVMGRRSRAPRVVLYGLWVMVAVFGIGGFNDHRLPRPADTITDQRERPPFAPLVFTGLAIAGVAALRSGSKEA